MDESNPYQMPPADAPHQPAGMPPTQEECNFAVLAHLSGIAGVLGAGLLGFVGPLIIYLLKGETSAYIASQSKEALNFQITLLIFALICLAIVVLSCGTLFPLAFIPMILQVVFGIIAALAAREGQAYRYPGNIRLIK